MSVQIEETTENGVPVIRISGRCGAETVPELQERFADVMRRHWKGPVIADLTATDYLDVATLGLLIGYLKRLKERGDELRLVVNTEPIARIFEVTGLKVVFPIYRTVAEAAAPPTRGTIIN